MRNKIRTEEALDTIIKNYEAALNLQFYRADKVRNKDTRDMLWYRAKGSEGNDVLIITRGDNSFQVLMSSSLMRWDDDIAALGKMMLVGRGEAA